MITQNKNLVLAIPKGRVGNELEPYFARLGIVPEDEFYQSDSRKLLFRTNLNALSIIRVRSFDVVTHVAFGGASLGVVGSDIVAEFQSPEIIAPVNLGFGHCRLSLAELADSSAHHFAGLGAGLGDSHNTVRVATKYPRLTKAHFLSQGMQCETIKLNGAIELAPKLGICPRVVDLVSTGETLKTNGLVETETIMEVSARLVVNRVRMKTASAQHHAWIEKFREATDGA